MYCLRTSIRIARITRDGGLLGSRDTPEKRMIPDVKKPRFAKPTVGVAGEYCMHTDTNLYTYGHVLHTYMYICI